MQSNNKMSLAKPKAQARGQGWRFVQMWETSKLKSLQRVSEIIRNGCRKPRAERMQQITFRECLAMKHLATLSSGLKKERSVGQEWSQENRNTPSVRARAASGPELPHVPGHPLG